MQGKIVDSVDAMWAHLTSRAIRVAMTRSDVSYAQLADALTREGIEESSRSVEGKVQRGTFRFSFFLEALAASRSEYPPHWSPTFSGKLSWDRRASRLIRRELALSPWLDDRKLCGRLEEIGVGIEPTTLSRQLDEGTFAATLFFQCATVCHFEGVHFFLNPADLYDVALHGARVWSGR
ncbi:hypothetical protein F6X42_01425 [Paraburkholderia sp. WC7.3b]|uniref:DUF6471 domain-containing protein n=2 Tax=Burkholderiaceae TaxID=119060 RepID=A0ABR7PG59_9BURK|nr:hypothetical protein [Paraburkholderia podalyriae]